MSPQRPQRRLGDSDLGPYLAELGLIPAGESIEVEPAGDGNINWVRRARAPRSGRSWVVKQARPALERFPEYRVSTERIAFEARYYEVAAPFDRERLCPRVHHFDPAESVLVLEDLGSADRLDAALGRGDDASAPARALGAFLGAVHAGTRGAAPALAPRFANGEMQRLHGDHVFHLPYRPNDFPLPAALRPAARALQDDAALIEQIDAAYARYLGPGCCLVHADVQPANVLLPGAGPKLLDAEIAHVGDPAFDVGVLVAHLALGALARGEPAGAGPALRAAWSAYAETHGSRERVAFEEVARYAGIELLRRTVGAARVAAVAEERAARRALAAGVAWIREPPDGPDALARGG